MYLSLCFLLFLHLVFSPSSATEIVSDPEWIKSRSSLADFYTFEDDQVAGPTRSKRHLCVELYTHEDVVKEITSPNYPKSYANLLDCRYTILVPPHHIIEVEFIDFRIEIPLSLTGNCTYDGLTITDGGGDVEPIGRYCGKRKPSNFISRSNRILLHLYSDDSLGFRGFLLRYRVHCGHTFFSDYGTLRFREDDLHISADNTCEYTLIANPNMYVDLNFTVLNLTQTHVMVYDHENLIRSMRQDYVYKSKSVRVLSIGNVVRIVFKYSDKARHGNVVIAFQTHLRRLINGDRVFLYHMQTCRGLYSSNNKNENRAQISSLTKNAILHQVKLVKERSDLGKERIYVHNGDIIQLKSRRRHVNKRDLVYRAAGSSPTRSTLEYAKSSKRDGRWAILGEMYHGGRIWLQHQADRIQYLGVNALFDHGQNPTMESNRTIQLQICHVPSDWILFKVPRDFGWHFWRNTGQQYEARWVDGLPEAVMRLCLPHPLVVPTCNGNNTVSCSS